MCLCRSKQCVRLDVSGLVHINAHPNVDQATWELRKILDAPIFHGEINFQSFNLKMANHSFSTHRPTQWPWISHNHSRNMKLTCCYSFCRHSHPPCDHAEFWVIWTEKTSTHGQVDFRIRITQAVHSRSREGSFILKNNIGQSRRAFSPDVCLCAASFIARWVTRTLDDPVRDADTDAKRH